MDLIIARLKHNPNELEALSALFEGRLEFIPLKDYKARYVHHYSIKNYRLILDKKDGFYYLRKRFSANSLISLRVAEISTRQIWAALSLFSRELLNTREDTAHFIKRIRPFFPYHIAIIKDPSKLDPILFEQVKRHYPNVYEYQQDRQQYFLLYMQSTQQILKLGPIASFATTPWYVVYPIVFSAIAFFGLLLYSVVLPLESHIKQLEQATNRLARGYLNVRVAADNVSYDVHPLSVGFNKMAGYIERLISIQREMVRAISHELRTPVARVRFGLQIVEDFAEDNPNITQQLKGIDGDIRELDELIDEILTYARLEDGAPVVDFQSANLAQQAMQVVSEARPPKGVRVSYSGLDEAQNIKATIEPRYIHRAIQNLVGNACRYAQANVHVRCEIAAGICRVDVEDDGVGIPEEDWERVFTPFARLDDSRTRSSGGYGLGLSIVQRIAYWHGGRVTLGHSEKLGGAHFSLVWPQYQD